MPITHRGKGYPIPDNPEPEGYHCVRVYVPDDSLYIGIFWQSLHYLASPRAWANDPEHTALIAAEVWRTAIQLSQDNDACASGDCGIMDIRQSEGVPCIIEKLDDCEGEWQQVVDMRLCVPKMRWIGGVLQQDTTGNGDWQDAGDPDNPYDPRIDGYAPPPWETPPAGEDGKCLSAANVAEYINFVASDAADWMVDGLSFFQALSGATAVMTALMDLIPLTLLTAFITALYGQVIDDWAHVRDFSVTAKLRELMVCLYNDDGSMNQSQWEELIQNLNDWRDTLTDNDQRAKWEIVILLVTLWGPVGMTIAGGIWGITTYDCAYNECQWTHVFDFTAEDGDFAQWETGWMSGEWVEGSGWEARLHNDADSYCRKQHDIRRQFSDTYISEIIWKIDYEEGSVVDQPGGALILKSVVGGVVKTQVRKNFNEISTGDIELSITPNQLIDEIRIFGACSNALDANCANADSGHAISYRLTVSGTGIDPFL